MLPSPASGAVPVHTGVWRVDDAMPLLLWSKQIDSLCPPSIMHTSVPLLPTHHTDFLIPLNQPQDASPAGLAPSTQQPPTATTTTITTTPDAPFRLPSQRLVALLLAISTSLSCSCPAPVRPHAAGGALRGGLNAAVSVLLLRGGKPTDLGRLLAVSVPATLHHAPTVITI